MERGAALQGYASYVYMKAHMNEKPDRDTPEDAPARLPIDTEPDTKPVVDAAAQSTNQEPVSTAPSEQPPVVHTQPFYKRKKFLIVLAVLAVAAIAIATFVIVMQKSVTKNDQEASVQRSLLGAAVTVLDGAAQYGSDNESWQDLSLDSKLSEGTYIRTGEGARVVVTLDDGSAIRINSISTIHLESLDSQNIAIENVSGEVYTRVVASERTFTVSSGEESYQALGTAYKTVNKTDVKGVEVYQSSVSVKKAGQTVAEGKRYYIESSSAELKNVVSDIPLDQLQKDEFLKWNLEKDKAATEFKDRLGYLKKLEEAPAPAPVPTPKPTPAPTVASGVVLSGSATAKGAALSWKLSGVSAPKGFKIVYSKEANPTFGSSQATYVSDPGARSSEIKIKDGKTYYFRVCIYTGDGCTNYSNNVKLVMPAYTPPAQPSGTLNLTHTGGNSFSWTLNGSSPGGHKLVWSTSPGPTYGSSSARYYSEGSKSGASIEAGSGSYYVRVCMYYEGGCINYSNEVYVTLP